MHPHILTHGMKDRLMVAKIITHAKKFKNPFACVIILATMKQPLSKEATKRFNCIIKTIYWKSKQRYS